MDMPHPSQHRADLPPASLQNTSCLDSMKLPPVLVPAVLLCAGLVAVHADFYMNLFYPETKKYLSVISMLGSGFENEHFIKASKDSPDGFCKFNFVTTNLSEGKVSFQLTNGNYFNLTRSNYIQPGGTVSNASSEFDFIYESDPGRKHGARIALKGYNGLYWTVVEKYVKAESTKPVFFDIYPVVN